jgi:GAF domain-containing protein
MFAAASARPDSKPLLYDELLAQARALFEGERDPLANSANLAALVYHTLPELNWAGFYWMKGGELVLGPFQGKPACVRIALGKGVCGAAARARETIVVPRSEIVVPIVRGGRALGVLDVDSPVLARFDAEDRRGLEAIVAAFIEATDLPA